MIERALWVSLVVCVNVGRERGFEICPLFEARLPDDPGDAAVESLSHAVGLRVTERRQAMLDLQPRATFVKGVLARRLLGFAGEPVCEWACVVGEQLGDLNWRGLVQTKREVAAAGFGLAHTGAHEHPRYGAVNGQEKITSAGLLGHLRQVLDAGMYEPGFVALERLDFRLLNFCKVWLVAQQRYAVPPQAAIKPRARNNRIDELSCRQHQVTQRRALEFDHHSLLHQRQCGAELVRTAREVLRVVPVLPVARRGLARVLTRRQLSQSRAGRLDFRARSRRPPGLRVYSAHAVYSSSMASMTPRITSLARNKGQPPIGK